MQLNLSPHFSVQTRILLLIYQATSSLPTTYTTADKKVRVYLAAQVLSNSITEALEYCQTKIQGWEEIDGSGTTKFLPNMNTLFDRMNSKNPFGKLLHSPLCTASHDEIFEDISRGQRFILSSTLRPSNSQHPDDEPEKKTESLFVCSPKKKGFLGFL
jgi:hypothetical protein